MLIFHSETLLNFFINRGKCWGIDSGCLETRVLSAPPSGSGASLCLLAPLLWGERCCLTPWPSQRLLAVLMSAVGVSVLYHVDEGLSYHWFSEYFYHEKMLNLVKYFPALS